ncbi:MAG: hypothetical protein ACE5GX_07250 [Thermoanaerobaculia bacterium]
MRRLRIEFDKFMAGASRVPPEEFRFQIERRIRHMRQAKLRSFAQRFRLGSLEASFNTLCELHGRRLRDIEQGKVAHPRRAEARPQLDPTRGFVLGDKADRSALEALYKKLYGASGRESKTDFGSFEKHVAKQVQSLQKKTGCRQVHLRVTEDGGTLKLKAKPVRKEESS